MHETNAVHEFFNVYTVINVIPLTTLVRHNWFMYVVNLCFHRIVKYLMIMELSDSFSLIFFLPICGVNKYFAKLVVFQSVFMVAMSSTKYFEVLKSLPRVTTDNIKANPYSSKLVHRGIRRKKKGVKYPSPNIKPPIGMHGKNPFVLQIPKYGFNRDSDLKRQYRPFSLWQLQNLIDLGRIDPSKPIDLNTIANTRRLKLDRAGPTCYGVYLVEQGANIFEAKVNIEVQIADELSIASIEKCGGTISTTFYDKPSLEILVNPVKFFLRGKPIPKRLLPPEDLVPYYTDPKVRGYLSDPRDIYGERFKLAAKFGYDLPDISKDKRFEMLAMRKDPKQVFYGLDPGSVVNLADEVVIKPISEYLTEHSVV